jgi:hypothetical protein
VGQKLTSRAFFVNKVMLQNAGLQQVIAENAKGKEPLIGRNRILKSILLIEILKQG